MFTRRFSADVNERQAQDIQEILKLKKDSNSNLKLPKADIKFDFKKSTFSAGNADSRTLILLLNAMMPFSFLSGAKIDTDKILKKSSQHEFHHIYPLKYLEKKGVERKEANVLANICFLTRGDNNKIKDKSPSEYLALIDKSMIETYMRNALCPDDFSSMEYNVFLEERTKILVDKANQLMT